jgi:acyl-coenzyme A thioesterase PaaI-like protein
MHNPDLAPINAALGGLPYVQMLGLAMQFEAGELRGQLPFDEQLIGNPLVPALHGGVIAALLHFTAAAQLMLQTGSGNLPQIFTATTEYLANPELKTTYAGAVFITRTRRFANLRATAWQDDEAAPIAAATLQFLIGQT